MFFLLGIQDWGANGVNECPEKFSGECPVDVENYIKLLTVKNVMAGKNWLFRV